MHYYDGNFAGMHLIWWIIWLLFIAWVFFIPVDIPFQKTKNESPLDILKKRYAKGEISQEEFENERTVLNSDITLKP